MVRLRQRLPRCESVGPMAEVQTVMATAGSQNDTAYEMMDNLQCHLTMTAMQHSVYG
jgi:hypothetical protein